MKKFLSSLLDFLRIYFDSDGPVPVYPKKARREKFTAEIGRCVTFGKISGRLEISDADSNLCLVVVDSKGTRYKLHGFIPGAALNREAVIETSTDINSSLKISFFLGEIKEKMAKEFVGHLGIYTGWVRPISFGIYSNNRSIVQPLEDIISADFEGAETYVKKTDGEVHIIIKKK